DVDVAGARGGCNAAGGHAPLRLGTHAHGADERADVVARKAGQASGLDRAHRVDHAAAGGGGDACQKIAGAVARDRSADRERTLRAARPGGAHPELADPQVAAADAHRAAGRTALRGADPQVLNLRTAHAERSGDERAFDNALVGGADGHEAEIAENAQRAADLHVPARLVDERRVAVQPAGGADAKHRAGRQREAAADANLALGRVAYLHRIEANDLT